MTTLLSVSIAILAGLIMTRLVKPLKLPDVTAYLLAGVFVGPYCLGAIGIEGLGFTSNEAVTSLSLISEAALGFIAFSIGPVEIGFSSLLVCMMLGITLLPQAGVALGMCITARQLGAEGDLIRNIILFSVLIYELFGPMLTKYALTKAGDIHPMSDEVKNRREIKLSKLQQSKER